MSVALARILIRLIQRRQLQMNDYLLIFSCVCLTASIIMLYIATSVIYFFQILDLNGIGVITVFRRQNDFLIRQRVI